MRAKLMMLSIPLVVAVLVGGLFIATTSGATVGASSARAAPPSDQSSLPAREQVPQTSVAPSTASVAW